MKKITLVLISGLAFTSSLFGVDLSDKIENSSLVVYNTNIGLVHEERALSIKNGEESIRYGDVASSIDTSSINVTLHPEIELLSQHYRHDKLTLKKLLQANIGKKVDVRLLRNKNEFKIITATLLSYSHNEALVRTIDYKIITVANKNIIFDEAAQEFTTEPSLLWKVNTTADVNCDVKLDYLIKNISFTSNYILNLDGNNSSLSGWVSIKNNSGKDFKDTKLLLLAGDINRAQQPPRLYRAKALQSNSTTIVENAYAGYHLYRVPFHVSLANNETTQIKFLEQSPIHIHTQYKVSLSNPLYLHGQRSAKVEQFVTLAPLEVALPQGTIRTYSHLQDETILLGETAIEHTAKRTPLNLKLGTNFDTKVVQSVLQRDDSKEYLRADIEYKVMNQSDTIKTIELNVPFAPDEENTFTTQTEYTLSQEQTLRFIVVLNPQTETTFQVHYESKK